MGFNDNNDPHCEFGIFYYNKQDKRIFCPKRIPMMGWAINFANPYSIIIISILLIVTFVLVRYYDTH
ncbi:MAG: DUF5808 domain-containing protein [Bacteroidia bacterium]